MIHGIINSTTWIYVIIRHFNVEYHSTSDCESILIRSGRKWAGPTLEAPDVKYLIVWTNSLRMLMLMLAILGADQKERGLGTIMLRVLWYFGELLASHNTMTNEN